VILPRGQGSFPLGRLAEDKSSENVNTAKREEEEGRDKGESVQVMRENSSTNKHLDETKRSKAEFLAQNWEEPGEENGRPPKLGEQQDNDLENDEEAIEDGPERACWLVWNGASTVIRQMGSGNMFPWRRAG